MPSELPFNPAPRSKIRERLLEQQLARLERFEAGLQALDAPRVVSLSPNEYSRVPRTLGEVSEQRAAIQRVQVATRIQNKAIEDFNDAQRGTLYRAGDKSGSFYRSSNDRAAAIAGIIERQRRLSRPLSRDQWNRAQAIAAASRRSTSEHSMQSHAQQGVFVVGGEDPCEEVDRKQRNRREVMFATGVIAGYRTRKTKRRC